MPATASWPRIPATTLADQVYHAVRARILDGHLAPGEFIREKDLNEAMGVSRTPVREALGRLASEGFLERIPHRGFRVPEEPLGELLELYPIVASLDLLAGRLALPKMGSPEIARLKKLNQRLEAAKDRGDVRALIELNNEFHDLFGERSGNRRLRELLRDLRTQLGRLERWYYSSAEHAQQSISEHDKIIRSLEEGDHERTLELFESNMALTYKSLLEESGMQEG
ncbi:MAG TPA: GntR family transcriptional regulator [Longimicrobiaceae bacterium]|nr:GntR family transcriptional regulator [Longimicrobiaceae bacterium]